MELTFAPRGILQIDGASICYKNFSGKPDMFTREGDRSFSLIIPDEGLMKALCGEGWNVKVKEARDRDDNPIPGEPPFMHLPVKVKFNDRGPKIYLQTGDRKTELDEDTVGCLDNAELINVDLDIRPYDWEVNGKSGRTAYLQGMCATQAIDRFSARFAEDEYPEE